MMDNTVMFCHIIYKLTDSHSFIQVPVNVEEKAQHLSAEGE